MTRHLHRCTVCRQKKPRASFRFVPATVNAQTSRLSRGAVCDECQRQAHAQRSADPVAQRKWEMRPYKNRDCTLRAMGFSSYADYLASDLWAKIRARVLRLRNYTCQACGGRATLVHHNLYRRQELSGQSLKGMKALCHDCHKRVEFDGRHKVGLVEASHRANAAIG